MDCRKGQGAVEYLSIYAIAFAIVLVVLAAVYYIFIAPGNQPITPVCKFPIDIACIDFYVKSNGNLTIVIRQTSGHPITVTGLNCTAQNNPSAVTKSMNVQFNDGEQKLLVDNQPCYRSSGDVATGSVGSYYAGKLYIRYNETDTGFSHLLVGDIVAQYE